MEARADTHAAYVVRDAPGSRKAYLEDMVGRHLQPVLYYWRQLLGRNDDDVLTFVTLISDT